MSTKKIYVGFASCAMLVTLLAGCGGKTEAEKIVDQAYEKVNFTHRQLEGNQSLLKFVLIDEARVELTWTTSDARVEVRDEGAETTYTLAPTIPEYGGTSYTFTLTAHLSYETATRDKVFSDIAVMPSTVDPSGIVSCDSVTDFYTKYNNRDFTVNNEVVRVTGTVVVEGKGCLYISDGVNMLNIFGNSYATSYDVGDKLTVTGKVANYNTTIQYSYSTEPAIVIEKVGTDLVTKMPTAVVQTIDQIHALPVDTDAAISGKVYRITTTPKMVDGAMTLTADGTSNTLVTYPSSQPDASTAALESYLGMKITADFVYYTKHSSRGPTVLFLGTSDDITVETVPDADKVAVAKENLTIETRVSADFVLPKVGSYDVPITWVSDKTNVISIGAETADGYPATVNVPDPAETVKLTATLSLSGVDPVTKDFNVVVGVRNFETSNFTITSFADAKALVPNSGDNSAEAIYVLGYIAAITNTRYGNGSIENADGETLTIYGLYNYSGIIRYENMDPKPVVGDRVVLYGHMTHHATGGIQILNARMVEYNGEVQSAPALTDITAPTELSVEVGKTRPISVTAVPTDAELDLSYTSSNAEIATVSEEGVVTGVAIGTTTITVASTSIPSITKDIAITVIEAISGRAITITATDLGIAGTSSYSDGTNKTIGGTPFDFIELMAGSNGIQMRTKNGKSSTLWNTAAFATGILRVEFTYNEDKATNDGTNDIKIEFAADNAFTDADTKYMSLVNGQTSYTITPDDLTNTFVRIMHNTTYTRYFDSITIYVAAE